MSDHLFVYGTLAPGRQNQRLLANVPGAWRAATLQGWKLDDRWAARSGYPGIVRADKEDTVSGLIFSSRGLSEHWARLDAFEGEQYERIRVTAKLDDGSAQDAWVYAVRTSMPDGAGKG